MLRMTEMEMQNISDNKIVPPNRFEILSSSNDQIIFY